MGSCWFCRNILKFPYYPRIHTSSLRIVPSSLRKWSVLRCSKQWRAREVRCFARCDTLIQLPAGRYDVTKFSPPGPYVTRRAQLCTEFPHTQRSPSAAFATQFNLDSYIHDYVGVIQLHGTLLMDKTRWSLLFAELKHRVASHSGAR